jgi:hypothetical protein
VSKQVIKRVLVRARKYNFTVGLWRCAYYAFHPQSNACMGRHHTEGACKGLSCVGCKWWLPEPWGDKDILTLYSDGTVGHEKGAGA